jgi:DNA invertase Pin-like site-specific DNA recombinase
MLLLNNHKVQASHLKRNAYLYIRQSTLKQVVNNQESTKRQYALRERAVALGWALEKVIIVDDDLGKSGATATYRDGFQRLSAEVSMGYAGIVIGLEVSRLARNNADWHRLLEICALTQTLILDEDGIYDPASFNDRLLLGLKGTMSEAELHVLRARLQGGILNKATRGELKIPLPAGFVYDVLGRVQLDPDKQIQNTIIFFFSSFQKVGSATGIVKVFATENLKIPQRVRKGLHKGELMELPLTHSRALKMLHNPRYAGAFVYGRRRTSHIVGTSKIQTLSQEDWHTLIPNAHPGYISWEDYENNKKKLLENAQANGADRRKSPPREGPALLQGLIACGICGKRMTLRYHSRQGKLVPTYLCQLEGIRNGNRICQTIPGNEIDKAIGNRLIEIVSPKVLEIALTVQQELDSRSDQTDALRQQHVERTKYEADLARRRYMQADPDNRLVAATLEADWNSKLKALDEAQREFEKQKNHTRKNLDDEKCNQILALANNFSLLWHDEGTSDADRKKIIRLLIEDVTLQKKSEITIQIRYKGGKLETLSLPKPLKSWQQTQTTPEVLEEMNILLEGHINEEVAKILNERGRKTGFGLPFSARLVAAIAKRNGIKSRYEHLRSQGLLTLSEIAQRLEVNPMTIKKWHKAGLIQGYPYSFRNECLYVYSESGMPTKMLGVRFSKRKKLVNI